MSTHHPHLTAGGPVNIQHGQSAVEALDLMAQALALLDSTEAPADAGAHLDHAMHRLREWIGEGLLR